MDLLRELVELQGPSGNEQEVRSFIRNYMKKYVSDCFVDKF